jgi:hypothetical protein
VQIKTRVAGVLAVTAAAVAMFGSTALAGNGPNTGNVTGVANFSLLSGNLVETPVNVPTNICGVAVSLLGFSNAGCEGGAAVISDSGNTSGDDFDLGGF